MQTKLAKDLPEGEKCLSNCIHFICEYNFPRLLVQNEGLKMEVRVSIKLDGITFLHFTFDI